MKILYFITLISFLTVQILADNAACKASASKYKNCIAVVNEKKDYSSVCKTYNSEDCQNLYNSPNVALKGCDAKFVETTKRAFEKIHYVLKFTCATDEQGNYCPLSKIIQKSQFSTDIKKQNLSEILNSVKTSCTSKKCMKIANSYLNGIKTMSSAIKNLTKKDMEEINSSLNTLKKCNRESGNNNSNSNNNNNSNGNANNNSNNNANGNSNNSNTGGNANSNTNPVAGNDVNGSTNNNNVNDGNSGNTLVGTNNDNTVLGNNNTSQMPILNPTNNNLIPEKSGSQSNIILSITALLLAIVINRFFLN